MYPCLARPISCAHTFTTLLTTCAISPSQSSTSLTYTAGQVYHPLVACTMSHRPRLLSLLMLFLPFRPKYVQLASSQVRLGVQFWTLNHVLPCVSNG